MNSLINQIANYLWNQSWQIAILVLIVASVTYMLKNKNAHIRYLLWLIIVAKCIFPPLLTIALPVLPHNDIPEPTEIQATQAQDIIITTGSLPAANNYQSPATIEQKKQSRFGSLAELSISTWLIIIWIAGVSTFLIIALFRAVRTQRWLIGNRQQLPLKFQNYVNDFANRITVTNKPNIWIIDSIGQPFVWGIFRGSIYLPKSFTSINDSNQKNTVLAHELSHIARFDALVNLVQIIAQSLFWFHPFVWWANKKIRAEREKCCDETAIAQTAAKPKAFSSAIVDALITEHKSAMTVPTLAVAGPVKNIEERIKTIMKPNKKFYKKPTLLNTFLIFLLALVIVPASLALTERNAIDKTVKNMVGTWYFNNPLGDDEQMSIFENGSVIVWYSNGHIDKTWLNDSLIELKEYNSTVRTTLSDKDTIIQFSPSENSGFAKVWKRIDNTANTFLMIPLTGEEQVSEYINTDETAIKVTTDKYVKRLESAKKLADLGKVLLIYADDNEEKFPDEIQELQAYDISPEQLLWYSNNLVYLGKGKTPMNEPSIVLAYDKILLQTDEGTNVLFNDGYVQFVQADKLKDLGVIIPTIRIEARILSVPVDNNDINAFLDEIARTDDQPPGTDSLVLNDQQCEKLIKLIQIIPDAKILTSPAVMVYDRQSATVKVSTTVPYVCDVDENDLDPNGNPKPIIEYIDVGTKLDLTAKLLKEEKIFLDFLLEHTEIIGYEDVTFRENYLYKNPTIQTNSISSKATVLSRRNLLIKTKPIEGKQLLILMKTEKAVGI